MPRIMAVLFQGHRLRLQPPLQTGKLMSSESQLVTAFGTFTLERFPKAKTPAGKQQPLRAWDAADELLLQWLDEQRDRLPAAPKTLILNDSFGALTVALQSWSCWSQTDSLLAHQGCVHNLQQQVHIGPEAQMAAAQRLLSSLEWPEQTLDLVVIKVPKTLALLEDQLFNLRQVISPRTVVVAAGMTKNIHNSTLELFGRILGTTTTSLAKKKARLIFSEPQPELWRGQSAYPSQYAAPEFPFAIHNCANVFSRGGLDIGTRFLLEHFPQLPAAGTIIDLGCGNGLLGIQAQHLYPQAQVHFVDESYMAVESARINAAAAQACGFIPPGPDTRHFQVNNSLTGMANNLADLIVNNPPFHQQTVIGDHIAWQMFTDAKRVLRSGGELWVVGNRHLDYHLKLKRLFGHCETVAGNRKFVILRSVKP